MAFPYRGPKTLAQMKELWLSAMLTRETYVWLEGGPTTSWKLISALPELHSFLKGAGARSKTAPVHKAQWFFKVSH